MGKKNNVIYSIKFCGPKEVDTERDFVCRRNKYIHLKNGMIEQNLTNRD